MSEGKGIKFILQQQRHKNDSSGNPRRLWVFHTVEDGRPVRVVDEGYGGRPKTGPETLEISPVDVTPSEYQATRRYAKDQGILECGS